jgi:hypothetical protein
MWVMSWQTPLRSTHASAAGRMHPVMPGMYSTASPMAAAIARAARPRIGVLRGDRARDLRDFGVRRGARGLPEHLDRLDRAPPRARGDPSDVGELDRPRPHLDERAR